VQEPLLEEPEESPMPRPTLPPDREYERLNPGASPDSAQPEGDGKPAGEKSNAALPGSQNADLRGAKRDRRPRGATT
jgi:hypothetical protein